MDEKKIKEFAYFHKAGKLPPESSDKSTHGIIMYEGRVITHPLPYALLQHKKKELIQHGFRKELLKIKAYKK